MKPEIILTTTDKGASVTISRWSFARVLKALRAAGHRPKREGRSWRIPTSRGQVLIYSKEARNG